MRVLVAIDGSECAGVAVDLVAGLHWPTGTEIKVAEVVPSGAAVFGGPWPPVAPVDTGAIDRGIREQATRDLQAAAEALAGPGREIDTVAVAGRAGDTITSLAEQSDADLIVVGSRGHGGEHRAGSRSGVEGGSCQAGTGAPAAGGRGRHLVPG